MPSAVAGNCNPAVLANLAIPRIEALANLAAAGIERPRLPDLSATGHLGALVPFSVASSLKSPRRSLLGRCGSLGKYKGGTNS